MTEEEVEIIIPRTKERYPEIRPHIISDNGPQFIAKDFNPNDPFEGKERSKG